MESKNLEMRNDKNERIEIWKKLTLIPLKKLNIYFWKSYLNINLILIKINIITITIIIIKIIIITISIIFIIITTFLKKIILPHSIL